MDLCGLSSRLLPWQYIFLLSITCSLSFANFRTYPFNRWLNVHFFLTSISIFLCITHIPHKTYSFLIYNKHADFSVICQLSQLLTELWHVAPYATVWEEFTLYIFYLWFNWFYDSLDLSKIHYLSVTFIINNKNNKN